MRARLFWALPLAAGLAACRGTAPDVNGSPERGKSALLLGARMLSPDGEAKNGEMTVGFEGEDGGPRYRLAIGPRQRLLFQIEPGRYRFAPTRTAFGSAQTELVVSIDGKEYAAPFPPDLLRRGVMDVPSGEVLAVGVLEARRASLAPGETAVSLALDSSLATRRKLVQDVVRLMMDPKAPPELRDDAVAWTAALERALNRLNAEAAKGPAPKDPRPYATP